MGKAELESELAAMGEPRFRAEQVLRWVFGARADSFEAMTNLSRELRSRLAERFALRTMALARKQGVRSQSVIIETMGLPVADIIDVAEEKTRLEKSLAKLDKEIAGLNGRLKNPKFAENAPEEVVAEAQDNLAAREDEAGKLREALARLAEIG